MANQVIDLRKINQETPAPASKPETTHVPVMKPGKTALQWSAPEYEKKERGPYWFLGPGIIALVLVLLGILTQSYFFIAFVVLAFAVLMMYAKRDPLTISCILNDEGVTIGKKSYKFSDLKSFWIFERPKEKELSLQTGKTLAPFIRLPLGSTDPKKVRDLLSQFLSEEEHKDFISDQLARGLGF